MSTAIVQPSVSIAGAPVPRVPRPSLAAQRDDSDGEARAVRGDGADGAAGAAVESANRVIPRIASELRFEFHKEAGRIVVRLVDRRTQEVLRQIPSEQMLAIADALAEHRAAGVLLRSSA